MNICPYQTCPFIFQRLPDFRVVFNAKNVRQIVLGMAARRDEEREHEGRINVFPFTVGKDAVDVGLVNTEF